MVVRQSRHGLLLAAKGRVHTLGAAKSRNEETGAETEGTWTSLVINHGKAPKNAEYEYAVMPQATAEQMEAFAQHPLTR